MTQIDEVRNNVVSWLSNTNYDSAMEALREGNDKIVNELVAIYENIDSITDMEIMVVKIIAIIFQIYQNA